MKNIIYIVLFISSICLGQDKTITGTVTDEAGDVLPGVSVFAGTETKLIGGTDMEGKYTLPASVGQVLQFKYEGFKSQSVTIGEASQINITMPLNDTPLVVDYFAGHKIVSAYMLTEADKDSLYAAAFNGQIVQQAIKAKFKGKSKLFERGYEMELLSLLKSDSISNDSKKQLLTRRLIADAEYDKANNVQADRRKWCPQNGLDKNAAIDFYRCLTISDFTACLYVVDGLLYTPASANGVQSLLNVLRKTEIATLQVLRGDEGATVLYCQTPPDVIIITTAKH